jgi:hypothetical protein
MLLNQQGVSDESNFHAGGRGPRRAGGRRRRRPSRPAQRRQFPSGAERVPSGAERVPSGAATRAPARDERAASGISAGTERPTTRSFGRTVERRHYAVGFLASAVERRFQQLRADGFLGLAFEHSQRAIGIQSSFVVFERADLVRPVYVGKIYGGPVFVLPDVSEPVVDVRHAHLGRRTFELGPDRAGNVAANASQVADVGEEWPDVPRLDFTVGPLYEPGSQHGGHPGLSVAEHRTTQFDQQHRAKCKRSQDGRTHHECQQPHHVRDGKIDPACTGVARGDGGSVHL